MINHDIIERQLLGSAVSSKSNRRPTGSTGNGCAGTGAPLWSESVGRRRARFGPAAGASAAVWGPTRHHESRRTAGGNPRIDRLLPVVDQHVVVLRAVRMRTLLREGQRLAVFRHT